ncbi:MAG: bifunctional precorrin-2 dehydrogenase/sirohydrochlorin ferrochelatase [Sulfuricurvum sp.]|nr:bifunctional precorrin-2 dehydrogenase/sirohydrochlorin ferrochelatase [Sulfuricurvum sp.]
MALFPMFVDLQDQDIVVIGAGEIALRKIEQLIKFSPKLTVIAPLIHEEIKMLSNSHAITLLEREYIIEDCDNRFLVIGTLNDLLEQEKIYTACIKTKTPVNCVDSPLLCSFIFPALIVDGDLCVGINTSGKAPAVSSALRQYLTKRIPSGIGSLIDRVHAIRQSEGVGKERQDKIIKICSNFFSSMVKE